MQVSYSCGSKAMAVWQLADSALVSWPGSQSSTAHGSRNTITAHMAEAGRAVIVIAAPLIDEHGLALPEANNAMSAAM